MSPLRRVFGERASPTALGILIPPGRRTVLILRPRALAWDLLLTQPALEGAAYGSFRELTREEAEAAAEQLCRALEEWARGGTGCVEPVAMPDGQGYCVSGRVGALPLLACLRRPGQAYEPLVLAEESARAAAVDIASVLCPASGAVQEVYFNTRHFSRP